MPGFFVYCLLLELEGTELSVKVPEKVILKKMMLTKKVKMEEIEKAVLHERLCRFIIFFPVSIR